MQINLTGFLNGKNARLFMGELWELLLSAQASDNGIPESFTQQKKEEIKKRMVCTNCKVLFMMNRNKNLLVIIFFSVY